MEVNEENLENALTNNVKTPAQNESETPAKAQEMPKEMEVGFHQGALNTLAAERGELIKIIQNVEKIMGMHIQRLKELGYKMPQKTE